jgi:hypothetical protein
MPESAKQTVAASISLEGPESAESTPIVLVVSEVSSHDFASTIAALVSMEVPEDSKMPDEEMDDYETTPKRAEVNVVYLFTDYYIVEDIRWRQNSTLRWRVLYFRNHLTLSIISSLYI